MNKTEIKNKRIIDELNSEYSGASCELNFKNDFELLVAVILSAQCTDKRVNLVTKKLFEDYKTPVDFANLDQNKLEEYIKPCGLFHTKAKNIISASKDIVNKFNGKVPNDKQSLKSLAGVGEKTANVVVSTAFQIPAIAVDTHVFRVSKRLGLAKGNNVKVVQSELEKVIDKNLWSSSHYALVLHGRYVCKARKPLCENCKLKDDCKYYNKINKENKK